MSTTRLLILDDEPAVGQTMKLLAEHAGHVARFTTDPQEFFTLHRDWAPTHVAVDLVMPEMDGIDVLGVLAEDGSDAAIIISSGVAGRVLEAARRFASENGLHIAGVLPKPFGSAGLAALLTATTFPSGDDPRPARPGRPRAVTTADLDRALAEDQIRVAYQPKVACGTGTLAGYEALARWRHPELGDVPPDVFVGLAEREGLVDRLTDRVLGQALSWFAGTRRAPGVTLSVNVSARTLADPGLADGLGRLCAEHGVEPDEVIVELTETSTADDPVMSLRLLTRLRMKGFQLSLDDFGTGYSSMTQLARLPFSEIKVDRSFVMTALTSAESRTVVKSVIDLGHSLGLTTTAEGVEDRETYELLTSLGSDLAQGYYLGRPLPGEQARDWTSPLLP